MARCPIDLRLLFDCVGTDLGLSVRAGSRQSLRQSIGRLDHRRSQHRQGWCTIYARNDKQNLVDVVLKLMDYVLKMIGCLLNHGFCTNNCAFCTTHVKTAPILLKWLLVYEQPIERTVW